MALEIAIVRLNDMTRRALLALCLLIVSIAPTSADPAMRCFSVSEMTGWHSPDGRTIYIRTGADRYYRIDLAQKCSSLKSVNPQLVLISRQGGVICSVLDLGVKASQTPGGIPEPCFPTAMSQLSAAQAASLTKDERP